MNTELQNTVAGTDFNRGVWFRAACSGLWYRCRESAGDIDAWKEDGVLHIIDESPNSVICVKTPNENMRTRHTLQKAR
jgi:hypothetical protein